MRYWLYYLLGSLPYNWETLVVTLGNVTLYTIKSSQFDEKTRRKEHDSIFEHKSIVIETTSNRGRSNTRGTQNNKTNSSGRSKLKNKKVYSC